MKTTLNQIRKYHPCQDGWTKLIKHLGKTSADDEPVAILTILGGGYGGKQMTDDAHNERKNDVG